MVVRRISHLPPKCILNPEKGFYSLRLSNSYDKPKTLDDYENVNNKNCEILAVRGIDYSGSFKKEHNAHILIRTDIASGNSAVLQPCNS